LILPGAGRGLNEDERRIKKAVKATDAKIANRMIMSLRMVWFFGVTKINTQMLHLG
jgi:hypothetical protein